METLETLILIISIFTLFNIISVWILADDISKIKQAIEDKRKEK